MKRIARAILLFAVTGTAGLMTGVLGSPSPVHAHGYKMDEITVGHVWAPPPDGKDAGVHVYGAIVNRGTKPLRLVAVKTDVADKVSFLSKAGDAGEPVDSLTLMPGKPYAMAPWRGHIYLTGLHRTLSEDESFELTLEFGDGRLMDVRVLVEPKGGHG